MNKNGTLSIREYPSAIAMQAQAVADLNLSIRKQQAQIAAKEADLKENQLRHASEYRNAEERKAALEISQVRNICYTQMQERLSLLIHSRDNAIASHAQLRQEYQVELLYLQLQLSVKSPASVDNGELVLATE